MSWSLLRSWARILTFALFSEMRVSQFWLGLSFDIWQKYVRRVIPIIFPTQVCGKLLKLWCWTTPGASGRKTNPTTTYSGRYTRNDNLLVSNMDVKLNLWTQVLLTTSSTARWSPSSVTMSSPRTPAIMSLRWTQRSWGIWTGESETMHDVISNQ